MKLVASTVPQGLVLKNTLELFHLFIIKNSHKKHLYKVLGNIFINEFDRDMLMKLDDGKDGSCCQYRIILLMK